MGPRHKAGAAPRNERGGFGRVALAMRKELGARLLINLPLWSLIGVFSVSVVMLVSALLHDSYPEGSSRLDLKILDKKVRHLPRSGALQKFIAPT